MDQRLGSQIKKGYLWTLFGGGFKHVLSFLFGVALARMLAPSDFGIVAACLLFTEAANTLVGASFVSALVQRREVSARELSTVFVLQLAMGVGMALALVGASPLVGRLMGDPKIGAVLMVLALNPILLAFTAPSVVIAHRELDFRLLAFVGFGQITIHGLVGISLAWAGLGVWSLAWGRTASNAVAAFHLALATGWRPSLRFSWSVVSSLWKMAAQFGGKNILTDVSQNGDYLIVGWRLGVEPLGFYSRAYSLMTFSIRKLSKSLGAVLFPAFAKIQDERERLVRGMVKASGLISLTLFPLLIGLQLVAPDLITVVYGVKWLPSVPPLQVMCIAGLFYCLDPPAVSLIHAKGLLKEEISRQVVHTGALVIGVLGGTLWGTTGAAWGVVVAALTHWILLLHLLKRRMGLPVLGYLRALAPASVASAVMAVVVLMLRMGISRYAGMSGPITLVGSIGLGGATYFGMLCCLRWTGDRPLLNDAFRELESLLRGIRTRVKKVLAVEKARSAV
jgi:O-antigen/teichoic acid export membrane protein